jgi:ankyrin repeat protein
MATLLFASVEEINALGPEGQNALHFAAKQGHEKVIRLIVEAENSDGERPLSIAAQFGALDSVRVLVELGADVEVGQAGKLNHRPLHEAAKRGHETVVKALLELGADVNARGFEGQSPLFVAAMKGHAGVTKQLLRQGANTEVATIHDSTPLGAAAKLGHLAVVKALVAAGADLTATSSVGGTALHAAAQEGRTEVAKVLVDAGADLEATHPASLNSLTPLLFAVMRGQLETVKVFVEAGANVDATDASGQTALELSNRLHKHQPAVARTMASALQTPPVARSALHVPTAEEVRAMSVKELKAHLTRLHTDHSKCVEKSELVALLCAVSLAAAGQPPVARACGASSSSTAGGVEETVQVAVLTVEEAHAMTVRQLETQLAAAGVDYSAALEKSELVEMLLSQVSLN